MRLMHWLCKFSDADLLCCQQAGMTAKETAVQLHCSVNAVLRHARILHVVFRRARQWSEADDAVIRAWAARTIGTGAARVQLSVGLSALRLRALTLGLERPKPVPPMRTSEADDKPVRGRAPRTERRDLLLEKLHEVYGHPSFKPASPW